MSGFDHKAFLQTLTTRPGVYQMYDDRQQLLYVGKARNLRNRVSSYFRASGLTGPLRPGIWPGKNRWKCMSAM